MTDHIDVAKYVAEIARETWEPLWIGWKQVSGHPEPTREPPSTDACIPTSIALCEMLNRVLHKDGWYFRVAGGRPTRKKPKGGFWIEERGGTHAWVQGWQHKHNRLMTVDITCDQYDGPEVMVLEGKSPYHVENYSRDTIKMFREREGFNAELWVMTLELALQDAAKEVE